MKMITNYLSNLESYLPDDMQQDVREELEASIYGQIEDLKEQQGRQPDEDEVANILQKMGHPMRVASTYLPDQHLIDTDFYPAYKDSLQKVVLFYLAFKVLIMAPALFSGDISVGSVISGAFDMAEAGVYAFGMVTLIFWLLAKYDAKASLDHIYRWSPAELKGKSARLPLKRVEVLFELLFQILFIAWWNNFLTIPVSGTHAEVANSIAMSDHWSALTLPVNVLFGGAMLISLQKLFVAGWQKLTLVATICLDLVILGVLAQISHFDTYIVIDETILEPNKWQKVMDMIDYNVWSFLAVIAVFVVWEIYTCGKRLKR